MIRPPIVKKANGQVDAGSSVRLIPDEVEKGVRKYRLVLHFSETMEEGDRATFSIENELKSSRIVRYMNRSRIRIPGWNRRFPWEGRRKGANAAIICASI